MFGDTSPVLEMVSMENLAMLSNNRGGKCVTTMDYVRVHDNARGGGGREMMQGSVSSYSLLIKCRIQRW